MIDDKYKYSALTERIIGCAMKVHSTLGNGFQEIIYQRCLAIEMSKQGLSYEREKEMPIFYGVNLLELVALISSLQTASWLN
jgi:GxxExxY protein